MKRTTKIIIITLILILIVIIFGLYLNSKKLILEYRDNLEVLLNQEVYNLDNIKNIKNGKILTEKEQIDTTEISKKEITIKVENFFKKIKEYKYTITIVDKESPVITFKKDLETEQGEEINLLEDVKVEDNSKEEIKVTIEGEYDINKLSDYKLYYIAEDSSGNKTKEEFILHVKEKKIEEPITPPKKNNPNTNSNNTNSNNNQSSDKTFTTKKGFKGVIKNGITYIDGYMIVNKTYSLPSTYETTLTKETTDSFNKMKSAATLEGLNIYISSGFRSYNTQKRLYNNYVKRDGVEAADTYSARAGHSEHQSGLAFDVNTINDTFASTPEAKWLANNCYKYGFILRYPQGKSNETGYKYESWHFRYVGTELAEKLYNNGNWITMEDYFGITSTY